MKKTLEKIGAAISNTAKVMVAVIVIAFATTFETKAQVPTYAAQTLLTSYIVSAAGTSNSVAATIDCRKQQNVAIQWKSTGPITNLLSVSVSVDGVTYDTNHWVIQFTNSAASTFLTNLPVVGFGYARIDRVTDQGNLGSTNTVQYGVKISSP